MDGQASVMILGGSHNISSLQSDLGVLGFQSSLGNYPRVETADFIQNPPSVIMLDLTESDRDAISVCEVLLRDDFLPSETALVAVLSDNTIGRIPLDYNFTDIIKFPWDISELSFRLRRVIHLCHRDAAEDTIHIGEMTLSPSRYEVKVDGNRVDLSHKEYELLKFLVTHPNRVFTREQLLSSVWGDGLESDSRTVDVHIRRVRVKIDDIDNRYIKTVRGVGYVFRFDEAE